MPPGAPPENLGVPPLEAPREGAPDTTNADADTFFAHGGLADSADLMRTNPGKFREQEAGNSWERLRGAQEVIRAVNPSGLTFPPEHDPRTTRELEVGKIIDALTDIGTSERATPLNAQAKRYIFLRPTKAGGRTLDNMTFVTVKIAQVRTDIQILQRAKAMYPESSNQLDGLICALNALQSADPARRASFEFGERRSNAPVNRTFKYAGRLAGTVVFGGAALITGIMSIVNKNFSIAPLLYAGAAYGMVNPDAFTGRDRRQLRETSGLLANPLFLHGLAPRYGIQGEQWATAVDALFKMQGKANKPLDLYLRNGMTAEELATELGFAEGNEARGQILALLQNKPHFEQFLSMLKGARSRESRNFILEYIRAGSWRFARVPSAKGGARGNRDEEPVAPLDTTTP
jgi:hypothetical protein